MKNWTLRSEQFGALWEGTGQDRVPHPFDVVSSIPTYGAYRAEQDRIRAEFTGPENAELKIVLQVLAEPEAYVEISGVDADEAPVRIIGCQRQQSAVVAVQQPGPRVNIGGDVLIGCGRSGRLAAQIVGQMPQNSGGRRTFQLLGSAEEVGYRGSVLQPASGGSSLPRFERVPPTARAGDGTIRVHRGPRFGPGRDVGYVRWFDVAGDGRYVVRSHDPRTVHPCTPEQLVGGLDRLLRTAFE
ncbi:secretion protein [Rhodococcus sp. WMMA185]|uniref:ESX secretion-associated protein EspG n=1 Tax=Rhodococcus sp. WMMA185 TaxID=679318 RepID=UPI000878F91F|nr:ESX secretion-associated protein EspG [Rhodococcus sp. WMMA185]AOW93988.1 secretion protein [Rhodococcus sp. WMMA185]